MYTTKASSMLVIKFNSSQLSECIKWMFYIVCIVRFRRLNRFEKLFLRVLQILFYIYFEFVLTTFKWVDIKLPGKHGFMLVISVIQYVRCFPNKEAGTLKVTSIFLGNNFWINCFRFFNTLEHRWRMINSIPLARNCIW